ncbi:MAG: tetratricopeptide repeat protein [Nitrospirota bacterium]
MTSRRGLGRRRALGRLVWAWALALAAGGAAFAADDPLQRARAALERGDAPAAVVAASQVILSAPGDARLADAQRVLGLAYERAGSRGAAWQQYRLFLDNFPGHPARDDVADRADALVRRARERMMPLPVRWQVVSAGDARWTSSADDVAVVVAVNDRDNAARVGPRVTREAVDGARVWIRLEPGGVFDPFDDDAVTRLERRVLAAADWPIEGIVLDGVQLGAGASSPAADRAYAELARVVAEHPAGRDRLVWTWAGMRARASAAALRRVVVAARTVAPHIRWAIRISADAVLRPELAVREAGEDWAAFQAAAPDAVWAIDAPASATLGLAAALTEREARLPLARWTPDGGMTALR